ncbi:hypothetical protein ACQKCJ_14905 [Flavobacterium sp. NPDC079362]|uniref:hypothetical protein n=1 Tax=Flavobacterium sp. NPDC079362 TaxID=3390566 RepID=UPI003D01D82C
MIDWDEIKWIFEPDGALIDIYVQNVKIEDWKILINYLNANHIVNMVCQEKIKRLIKLI